MSLDSKGSVLSRKRQDGRFSRLVSFAVTARQPFVCSDIHGKGMVFHLAEESPQGVKLPEYGIEKFEVDQDIGLVNMFVAGPRSGFHYGT